MGRPKTCIVCQGRADSGEHIFPACAGGLRENSKIYCEAHNNAYGPLANEVGEQLCFFNANFLIKNTRKKRVRPVELQGEDGLIYEYDGTTLKLKGVQSLAASSETMAYVTSDPAAAQQKIAELQAAGYAVERPEQRTYHPGTLSKRLKFGGPIGLRAIGYIAQTFFAHCFPEQAREPAMAPFINYTLHGHGSDLVWWDFDRPEEADNHYSLGHRITVGIDAEARHAYARLSLYSTLDFAMIFYVFPPNQELSSQSVLNDIDPAAEKMPDDLVQRRESYAVSPVTRPTNPTGSLRINIENGGAQSRHAKLMQRASKFRSDRDTAELADKIANAKDSAAKQTVVREFWANETQRILLLLELGRSAMEQQQNKDPAKPVVISTLQAATQRVATAPSGLSMGAEAAIAVASKALTKAMLKDLAAGRLDDDLIARYIGTGYGAHIAAQAVLIDKNVIKATPPLRQYLLNTSSYSQMRFR